MKRRHALLVLASVLVPGLPAAQPSPQRIGLLYNGSRESAMRSGRYDAFLDGMRAAGRLPGKHFVMEERFSQGQTDLLPAFAAELVKAKVEVIVAVGTPAVHAARQATGTVPIVVALMGGDPVLGGFAQSLARPGRNVTGVYMSQVELLPKQLELLAAAAPKMTRVAVLTNPSNTVHAGLLQVVQKTAEKLHLQVVVFQARTAAEIEAVFPAMSRERAGGLLLLGDTFFVQQARQFAELALAHKLPLVSTTREYAHAGGLISYGEDSRENFRLAADHVDKILKGANAGDLPFRRSQRPLLVLNARTFKALGLAVPQELAARADEVIR